MPPQGFALRGRILLEAVAVFVRLRTTSLAVGVARHGSCIQAVPTPPRNDNLT
ncbi:hypothetical protein QFZ71_000411 [Streptomyces sp. V2I9]|nr:hypothetical protein [Streptomyces sp. V2I9]